MNLSASAFQTLPSLSLVLSCLHRAPTLAMSLNAETVLRKELPAGWLKCPPGIEKATDQFQQLCRETCEGALLWCSHTDLGTPLPASRRVSQVSFCYFICVPQFLLLCFVQNPESSKSLTQLLAQGFLKSPDYHSMDIVKWFLKKWHIHICFKENRKVSNASNQNAHQTNEALHE